MPSQRVRLFPHTPDHLRALMEGGNEYERLFGISVEIGVKDFFAGPEVSEEFLARLGKNDAADSWRDGFGIVHRSENRLIGLCSFNGAPDAAGAVEISYAIAPAYVGQGLATEAAHLLIEQAFSSSEVRVVRAHTLPEESASTRILQKCGFRHRGEVLDPVDGPVWLWEVARTTD